MGTIGKYFWKELYLRFIICLYWESKPNKLEFGASVGILFGFSQSFCPTAQLGSGAQSYTLSFWANLSACCICKSGSSRTSRTTLFQQLGNSATKTLCDLQQNYSPCHPSSGTPTTWCWGAGLTPHVPFLKGTHIGSPGWTASPPAMLGCGFPSGFMFWSWGTKILFEQNFKK